LVVQPFGECRLHQAILDDVGETRLAHFGGVEMNRAGASRIPNLHLAHRCDAMFHRFPRTDGLEDRDRGERDGANAQIVSLRGRRRGFAQLQHCDLEAGIAERAREQAAYHAATDNHDVIGKLHRTRE